MNLERHVDAHLDMFNHLVRGDGDSAEKHRDFYDEYMAVMDLAAEYYLQTVETVFVRHALPKGEMKHRDLPVDLKAIRRTGLMTVEGENDDISGVGQTQAAHELCSNIPANRKVDYLQKGVGHYGVFNGSRFRSEIAPRIGDFIAAIEHDNRARERAPAGGEGREVRCREMIESHSPRTRRVNRMARFSGSISTAGRSSSFRDRLRGLRHRRNRGSNRLVDRCIL